MGDYFVFLHLYPFPSPTPEKSECIWQQWSGVTGDFPACVGVQRGCRVPGVAGSQDLSHPPFRTGATPVLGIGHLPVDGYRTWALERSLLPGCSSRRWLTHPPGHSASSPSHLPSSQHCSLHSMHDPLQTVLLQWGCSPCMSRSMFAR